MKGSLILPWETQEQNHLLTSGLIPQFSVGRFGRKKAEVSEQLPSAHHPLGPHLCPVPQPSTYSLIAFPLCQGPEGPDFLVHR